MSSNFRVKFGDVNHGWYPIKISSEIGDFIIDASDVPIDPIAELIKAVEGACIYKSTSEAWFSLEPHYYKMVLEPLTEFTRISIYYVDEHGVSVKHNSKVQRETKEYEVSVKTEILLKSFWRGVKELSSRVPGYEKEIQVIEAAAKKI